MPLVGLLMSKLDPRRMLATGLVVCAFTMWQFSGLNLKAGYWEFFWPQLVMGLALGLLFVPLTTISMDPIPRETMGNATSLFNLVRNLGGSIGISVVSTLQVRLTQRNVHALGAHVNALSPQSSSTFFALKEMFLRASGDPVGAARQARAALFGMVQRQASMIAYIDVFRLLMFVFLIMLPFIFLMKRPTHTRGPAGMH